MTSLDDLRLGEAAPAPLRALAPTTFSLDDAAAEAVFSDSYRAARRGFRADAERAGFDLDAVAIDAVGPAGEPLTLDAAVRRPRGATARRAVVLSSGLHGIEGFFGSAAQRAVLRAPALLEAAEDATLVMIHAANPYGFAWMRRWNEDGVDLNRSFLPPGEDRPATPPLYRRLLGFLNPSSPPPLVDDFPPRILAQILRHGFTTLKNALPLGQYEYPKAMFFGGHGPSATEEILAGRLPNWVGPVREALHLDLHTGLGPFGSVKLLTGESASPARNVDGHADLIARFGAERVECAFAAEEDAASVGYAARGLIDDWLPTLFPSARYVCATAEFGTYPAVRVLQALRAENRAHHWGRIEAEHAWTKSLLLERFVPADPRWRRRVLETTLELTAQALPLAAPARA